MLVTGRDPLASRLLPVRKDGTATGLIEIESGLLENPPDEPQTPGDAILPSSKAIFLPVRPGGRFHHADLPCRNSKHSVTGLRFKRFHFCSPSTASCTFWLCVPK